MAKDIEDFLRRAAERRQQQQDKKRQSAPPPPPPQPMRPQPRPVPVEAVIIDDIEVIDPYQRQRSMQEQVHQNIDTSDIANHAEQLGEPDFECFSKRRAAGSSAP